MRRVVGVLVGWVTFGICPGTTAPPKDNYSLVFQDDFSTFDSRLWSEGVWFENSHAPRSDIYSDGKVLTLCRRSLDTSITTRSSWRYGYVETRLKWMPVKGAWPAVWLIPAEHTDAENGEIDLFEGQGDEPHSFFGTLHRWRGRNDVENTSRRNRFELPRGADFRDFHTYGLLWTPESVTWYFDGIALHSEPAYSVFARQYYVLVLSMQAGEAWTAGYLTGPGPHRFALTIDWVRVWQKR